MPQSDSGQKRKAFTLIELLIVVAIIAILAAIAVPNFLEAQTRAKIARVWADMRTITTAIESYSIDWNRVPIGTQEANRWQPQRWGLPGAISRVHEQSKLTTPVAYITGLPHDPFAIKGTIAKSGGFQGNSENILIYQYQSIRNATGQGRAMSAVTQQAALCANNLETPTPSPIRL